MNPYASLFLGVLAAILGVAGLTNIYVNFHNFRAAHGAIAARRLRRSVIGGGAAIVLLAGVITTGVSGWAIIKPAATPAPTQTVNQTSTATSQPLVTYTVDPRLSSPPPVPGLILTQGHPIHIVAKQGQWNCADPDTPFVGIQGAVAYTANQAYYAIPYAPFCSLIGRIANGPWQELGQQTDFMPNASGPLYLTVNELMPDICQELAHNRECYTDNEGSITIAISSN